MGQLDAFLEAFISDEYDKETRKRIQTLFKKWFVLLYKNSLSNDKFKTVSNVMLILTGRQQIGKTKFIHYLLPPELFVVFMYLPNKSNERVFNRVLLTRLLVNFRHIINAGIKSKRHWEKVKELIRSPWTVWFPRYSNDYITGSRIASYVATTNETKFLPEDEGLHRRVFVVKVRRYDQELLPDPEVFWGIVKNIALQDIHYFWSYWTREEGDFFAELAKQHIKK